MYLSHMRKIAQANSFSLSQHFFNRPALPLLDYLLNKVLREKRVSLEKTAIIYIHHPLQTSVNLVDSMIQLGAQPKNIFVLGKKYSECPAVVEQIRHYGIHYQPCSAQMGWGQFSHSFTRDINWLWKSVTDHLQEDVKNVLLLDHGGYATSFMPVPILEKYKVIGVEKTTAGLIRLNDQGLPPFPLIGVAHCATKKILESPLIAEAIVNKLLSLIPEDPYKATCGIIGYGAIGKAVATKLLAMGYKVILHDNNPIPLTNGITFTHGISELVASSDYIFSCTGQDSIKSIEPFRVSQTDKTLISCSSEDKEFLTLLKAIQKKNNTVVKNPFSEIHYSTDKGATIRVLRGGFPVNFDHSGESVPKKDIQLTRALVLLSILQAAEFFNNPQLLNRAGIYAVDPQMQRFIVKEWLKYQPTNRFAKHVTDKFEDLSWIRENSGGSYEPCTILEEVNTPLAYRSCSIV